MARQISDLPVMNANEGRDDDVVLIRDSSSQTDKKMTVAQLRALIGGVDYDELFPVGSVRILADSADHSSDFGQTWERYATGKTLVGLDSSDTDFNSIGKTGGEKTHKLTVDEMPSHKHALPYRSGGGGGSTWYTDPGTADGYSDSKAQSKGGDQPHNNLQPYIVVAFWRRTA